MMALEKLNIYLRTIASAAARVRGIRQQADIRVRKYMFSFGR